MLHKGRLGQDGASRRERDGGSVNGALTRVGRVAWQAILSAGILVLLLTGREPLGLELSRPARRDFRARVAFCSVNVERTQLLRDKARLREPAVFVEDPEAWEARVESVAEWLREGAGAGAGSRLTREQAELVEPLLPVLKERAEDVRGSLLSLSGGNLATMEQISDPLVREREATQVVVVSPDGSRRSVPIGALSPHSGASGPFRAALDPALEGMAAPDRDVVAETIVSLLGPQLSLDPEQSRQAMVLAARREPQIMKEVERGRLIVARGAIVERQHQEDAWRERRAYRESPTGRMALAQRVVGSAALLGVLMAVAGAYARRFRPELLERRLQALSFSLLTLILVALARLCVVRGAPLLWLPLALPVMVMSLVYGQRFGLAVAVFYGVLVQLATPATEGDMVALVVGGLTAALMTGQVRTRGALVKAGIVVGAVQFVAVWASGLVSGQGGEPIPVAFWRSQWLGLSAVALANGVLSGFVVSGALPAIERLFGVTTAIRLLEWSDPNQPLLQKLLLEAPGSYHHSMLVGSLAADAAEAVGADSLLARVSAYFHDVGKLKKPEYFAENVPTGGRNPHDGLSPTMSSLIITAHPRDGAEMAESYGVPREVRDIILQSHGSSVVRYFWDKASEGSDGQVKEHDFRYRLPKPQSREAAVVMLCDAAESAVRAVETASQKQIRNLVHEIIMDRLHDGQLDESGLTVPDLKRLEDSIVHGIGAAFHGRVRYPGQEERGADAAQEERGADAAQEERADGPQEQ
jgi:putative nucleotidyltransferase with HDIG domain